MTENLTPAIDVIVITRDRPHTVGLSLTALAQQTYPRAQMHVIVVDQSADYLTARIVEQMARAVNITYVRQPPLGIPAARNAGAGLAQGTLLLFLDGDLVAEPRLAAEHARLHGLWRNALVAGCILPYAPAYTSFLDRAAGPEDELARSSPEGEIPFYHAFGGNLSIPRRLFLDLQGFDEHLKGSEDTDLAYRVVKAGGKIVYAPGALAYHNHPRSLDERLNRWTAYTPMIGLLFQKHPELRGKIPHVDRMEPVDWRHDSWRRIADKCGMRLLSAPPVRGLLRYFLLLLIRQQRWPNLVRILFWRTQAAYQAAGVQAGIRTYCKG